MERLTRAEADAWVAAHRAKVERINGWWRISNIGPVYGVPYCEDEDYCVAVSLAQNTVEHERRRLQWGPGIFNCTILGLDTLNLSAYGER